MHKPLLLLFCTLILLSSCKRKNTPGPAEPVGTDSTTNSENIMAKQVDGGYMGKSIKCHDGNILALGTNVNGLAVIRKIAISTGSIIWEKEITDKYSEQFTGITETDDNDIVVSGYETTSLLDSLIVVGHNSNGDKKWRESFAEPDHDLHSPQLISLNNSNLLIYSGCYYFHSSNGTRLMRMLLDKDGAEITRAVMHTTFSCADLIRTSNNRVIALFNNLPAILHLQLFDETGTYLASGTVSSTLMLRCYAVKETSAGEFLCCGEQSNFGSNAKGFVARFSSDLDNLDYDTYDISDFQNIIPATDGFTVVGSNGGKAHTMACDASGDIKWQKDYPQYQGRSEYINSIHEGNPDYVLLGNCLPTSASMYFIMGADNDGNIHP